MRVRDCRTFGRFSLVGTHVLNSLHRYRFPKEGEPMERASIKEVPGALSLYFSELARPPEPMVCFLWKNDIFSLMYLIVIVKHLQILLGKLSINCM